MWRSASRACVTAFVGAVAGGASLVIAFALHPDLRFDIDRALPRTASGFYPVERSLSDDFRWTARRAEIRLVELDRDSPWRCLLRFRGGRPRDLPTAVVDIAIDGVTAARQSATNEYEDLNFTVPSRPRGTGLTLTITTTPPFIPGAADRRELGIQVNRLVCSPAETGVIPPLRAVKTAVLSGGMLGAALGLTGLAFWSAIAVILAIAVAQAVPFSTSPAFFGPYLDRVIWIAGCLGISLLASLKLVRLINRKALTRAAAFVIVYASGALYLKLLALLHPGKALVDAVFHAHRLEWVMRGRFYFTQPMPDGVQFPYAIALYIVTTPWTMFTHDYVTLLRVVVLAAEAITGALLYFLVVRSWGDRTVGVLAVILLSLSPLPYAIVGNANLTNAFGQSAALATMIAATVWPLRAGQRLPVVVLALLASTAFLSHVHTFGLLLAALVALTVAYRTFGAAIDAPARSILLATILAAVFAIGSYYGHFGDEYKTLVRVRTSTAAPAMEQRGNADAESARILRAKQAPGARQSLYDRALGALTASVKSAGWPICLLTIIGIWRIVVEGVRDRLGLALAAWGAAYLIFVAFGVLAPIDQRFERYAAEFIGRVNYATLPAACVLAARGGAWTWRAGLIPRVVSAALLIGAVVVGGQQWIGWMWR